MAYAIGMTDIARVVATRASDLVALDLDGMLLDTSAQFSEGIEDAVPVASEQGLLLSVAWGRGELGLLLYLPQLSFDTPYVASGRAYVATSTDGVVIQKSALDWGGRRGARRRGRGHEGRERFAVL